MRSILLALAIAGNLAPGTALAQTPASTDWRDQIIYFLMIDRFDDADPANNDQGLGEYDPTRNSHYSGGDLKGVARRLDYIRGLGATAVWITPPVANRWWDPKQQYTGYHGYWAEHLMQVDRHYGTLSDYQQLAKAMHGDGLLLIQDIVLNHMGDYFDYSAASDPNDLARGYVRYEQPAGAAPTQYPFSLNDPRRAADRKAGVYHWTPPIANYQDPVQEATWQMAGLDDLNTGNPLVRRALRQSYNYWIREVGVDGFRIDTAFYVPPEDVADFLHADDRAHPGVERYAATRQRPDFISFGEGFATDQPYAETQARRIDRYLTAPDGTPRMDGMINFPLYGSTLDVFARGRPSAELAYRIRSMMRVHARPHLMPSFVDNHDVDRFLAGGSEAALKQSLLLIMTLPGIPTIYYGTEQGFREPRAAMFKTGFGADGRDHFDTEAPLYRLIQSLTALRRAHPALSRGLPTILAENAASSGALAYRMDYQEQSLLIAFNSSDAPTLLVNVETGAAPGSTLQGVYQIDGAARDVVVDGQGRLTLVLPPRAGLVWTLPPRAGARLQIDPLASETLSTDLDLSGSAEGVSEFKLVVDGHLNEASSVRPGSDGRWTARLDTAAMIDPSIRHQVVAWSESPAAVSAGLGFQVTRDWTVAVDQADPSGDDTGPSGNYQYPSDPSWSEARPLDLEHVRISTSGGALKVDLTLHQLQAAWNPPNGFDHVAFNLYIELPGLAGGSTQMPLQNAQLPDGMRWHYRLRAHGWTNALFSADGASATRDGTSVTPTPSIAVDRATRRVSFTFPSSALGRLRSLSGARVYITTWDYDGGYRPLAPQAGTHNFGGGEPDDPLLMDDSGVLRVP